MVASNFIASALTAGLVVFFFKELTVLPHFVALSASSEKVWSGRADILVRMSRVISTSASVALLRAIVYSLRSISAREDMLLLPDFVLLVSLI